MLDNTTPTKPAIAYSGGWRIQIAPMPCPRCGGIPRPHDFDTRSHDMELICQGQGCGEILMRAEWVGE